MGTRRKSAFRLKVAAAVAGFVASGTLMYSASYAAFSSTATDGANNWAAGTVVLADNDANAVMFDSAVGAADGHINSSNMKPGDVVTNCIKVTYTGTIDATVQLYASAVSGSVGTSLLPYLHVKIEEGTGLGLFTANCTNFVSVTTLWDGTHLGAGPAASDLLSVFPVGASNNGPVSAVATWSTNTTRSYRFTITLDAAAPNGVQSGTAQASFNWQADPQ